MNTDTVISQELYLRIRTAKDDMQGAGWADAVIRKLTQQTPPDSELGRALILVRDRVHQFNQQADAAWRRANSEAEAEHSRQLQERRGHSLNFSKQSEPQTTNEHLPQRPS